MIHAAGKNFDVFLPMPVYPVIEDVGWWQGEDGSALGQPFRNAFPRSHCLQDYKALVRLASRLGVRIGLGMVLCEWDRNDILADIPGATWMGSRWSNQRNRGQQLHDAAEYLRSNQHCLEVGLHALCHEFWNEGQMERSEFHDSNGHMRSRQVIRSHLEAFATILEQNGFSELPRLFLPPALHHSFGNNKESIQALLYDYGIRWVITRFSRARQYAPPHHEKITWECGVGLLERGLSPVPWNVSASPPVWDFSGPIIPLHWGNLLHPNPAHNNRIVDEWADMLLAGTAGPERFFAETFEDCWRQMTICCYGELLLDSGSVIISLRALPEDLPGNGGPFSLIVRDRLRRPMVCHGARIVADRLDDSDTRTLRLMPEKRRKTIQLSFTDQALERSAPR